MVSLKHALAAAAAFAALAPVHAQEGGPPGSGNPFPDDYGEVETIIVIGTNRFRCPDGTKVAAVSHCPAYVSFSNNYLFAYFDPLTNMIWQMPAEEAPTCGATVDANCECGAGKVKVYDEDADAFHCYVEPPPAGCPKWDQTFDFDPSVWACVTRPFDDDAEDAAKRVRNCIGGVVGRNWNRIGSVLGYDSLPTGTLGRINGCNMVGGVPSVRAVELDRDQITQHANRQGDSPWQWMIDVVTHESIHVDDIFRHNVCEVLLDDDYIGELENGGYYPANDLDTANELHVQARTNAEYLANLGVPGPDDEQYDSAKHGTLSCPLEL